MVRLSRIRRYLAIEGLFILILCEFLLNLGIALWDPLLSIYLEIIGFTVVSIGLTSTIQGIFSTVTMLPAGLISDKIGRRPPLMLSYFLTLLYVATLLFTRDVHLILVMTAFYGISQGIRGTLVSAYVADHVPHERRGTAFASVSFFQLLAQILATAIGSYLATTFGFLSAFRTSFVIALAPLLVAAYRLFESLTMGAEKAARSQRTSLATSTLNAVKLLRNRNLGLLIAGATLHQMGMRMVFPFLSLYANSILGLSLITIGFLLNTRRIGDIVGQLPIGVLIDRFGGEFAIFLHVFLTAPIIYFYTVTRDFLLLLLIFFIWGSEAGWDIPSRRLLIIKFSKGVGTATALGSTQALIGLTAFFAPTIGGWVWEVFGPASVFQLSAIINILACIPLLALLIKARARKR